MLERAVNPTLLGGTETWGMKGQERNKVEVKETKCLGSVIGVTLLDGLII